jgi:hypothetical protein
LGYGGGERFAHGAGAWLPSIVKGLYHEATPDTASAGSGFRGRNHGVFTKRRTCLATMAVVGQGTSANPKKRSSTLIRIGLRPRRADPTLRMILTRTTPPTRAGFQAQTLTDTRVARVLTTVAVGENSRWGPLYIQCEELRKGEGPGCALSGVSLLYFRLQACVEWNTASILFLPKGLLYYS